MMMKEQADMIRERNFVLRAIREFFWDRGYIEVETPCLMNTAPPDPYIEPLQVYVGGSGPHYLHTSPEMGMKKLIGRGYDRIFQICKAFRVEEFEEHHAIEFTMLEWYMKGAYTEAMEETAELVRSVSRARGRMPAVDTFKVLRLGDLFVETAGFDPLPLGRQSLFSMMKERGFQGLAPEDTWEDLFFMLYVQDVEPRIREGEEGPCFIKDWPASLAAMAKKKNDHTVERFELYIRGLEIANGYTELLDADEQRKRLSRDNAARVNRGGQAFPLDEQFLDALVHITGPVAGVSVGVDRLLMALAEKERIGDVLFDRFTLSSGDEG
ncbi:MAG: EF-P lysine aminoacylase EpmA [Syntrophorhabdales bacterium]|jgi:lysyl-tRNA synthetase class 2